MVKIGHLRGAGLICPIFNIWGGSGGAEGGALVRVLRNLGYFKNFEDRGGRLRALGGRGGGIGGLRGAEGGGEGIAKKMVKKMRGEWIFFGGGLQVSKKTATFAALKNGEHSSVG